MNVKSCDLSNGKVSTWNARCLFYEVELLIIPTSQDEIESRDPACL